MIYEWIKLFFNRNSIFMPLLTFVILLLFSYLTVNHYSPTYLNADVLLNSIMSLQNITLLSNMFTNLNLTDMETCYKVFRANIIKGVTIKENRFGFEPEITAKVAKTRCRIYEVGISYYGRTYEEGKKIGWRDGFRALYCIIKYGI